MNCLQRLTLNLKLSDELLGGSCLLVHPAYWQKDSDAPAETVMHQQRLFHRGLGNRGPLKMGSYLRGMDRVDLRVIEAGFGSPKKGDYRAYRG